MPIKWYSDIKETKHSGIMGKQNLYSGQIHWNIKNVGGHVQFYTGVLLPT